MPHLIFEHSANFSQKLIVKLQKIFQDVMHSCEGNFDANQCKCRSFSFDDYLVGKIDQSNSLFLHIPNKLFIALISAIQINFIFLAKNCKKPQAVWLYSFHFLQFLSQKYLVNLDYK